MFDIGWTEMLVIAVVMIVVVGPKDLPGMLRTFGKTTKKLRSMAGDFQKQFNDALKEAELDDVKKSVDSLRSLNPAAEIKKQLNPFEKVAAEVRSGLDAAMKPKPADPASPVTHAAEPLKNGATAMPAAAALAVAPATSAFPAMADPAVATSTQAIPDEGAIEATPTKAAKTSAPKAAKVAAAKPAAKAVPAAKAATKPVAAKSTAKPVASKPASTPAKTASSKQKPAGSAT